ncbi:RloB family protein [Magnetococcales bacterium HHB-1]
MEGKKTEPAYFKGFNQPWKYPVVDVRPPSEGSKADPRQILADLIKRKGKHRDADDWQEQFWLVIDTEANLHARHIPEVIKKAKAEGFHLAISNPCFEVWLLCHFEKFGRMFENCEAVERDLSHCLEQRYNKKYQKNNIHFGDYSAFIDQAVEHAKEITRQEGQHSWPQSPGTDVWRLVQLLPSPSA